MSQQQKHRNKITTSEMKKTGYSFSPSIYRGVSIPNPNVQKLSALLIENNPYDKGIEPGALWYLKKSNKYFIRNKALQSFSTLIYPKGDSIIPINPRAFTDLGLKDWDILFSKDSNIGESAMLFGEDWGNYMFSGGIVRLNPVIDKFYLFAFLKQGLFKRQLYAMTPRGATIKHAKTIWLDCLIPFPNQDDADEVMKYVSSLMQVIVEKEIRIRNLDNEITQFIENELLRNQLPNSSFLFSHPSLQDILDQGRLDAAIYSKAYKEKIHLIENYAGGFVTPSQMGFTVIPGPSLEIKLLKTRVHSETRKIGYYSLILPKNISEYGTLNIMEYLGTPKTLPLLKEGDVLLGEAGFQKGRSLVLIDPIEKCTTNAHGLYARKRSLDIVSSIYFRCIFNWYRSNGLIDLIAVGGSGGHLSPSYFDKYIMIPSFPRELQEKIAAFYHNNRNNEMHMKGSRSELIEFHRNRNSSMGIFELDKDKSLIFEELEYVRERIILGEKVIL